MPKSSSQAFQIDVHLFYHLTVGGSFGTSHALCRNVVGQHSHEHITTTKPNTPSGLLFGQELWVSVGLTTRAKLRCQINLSEVQSLLLPSFAAAAPRTTLQRIGEDKKKLLAQASTSFIKDMVVSLSFLRVAAIDRSCDEKKQGATPAAHTPGLSRASSV